MADAKGKRGKWAEGKVREWLDDRCAADINFDAYRYPDARAGSFTVVPADYEAVLRGQLYMLEVKEVDHAFRLPHKNFDNGKVGRMVKRQYAGAYCWVLVCHMPAREWRLVPLSVFQTRTGGSWDLSRYGITTLDAAMKQIFGEKQ